MKHFLTAIILLLSNNLFLYSQDLSNFRTRKINMSNDSVILDTLSIAPNSVIIYDNKGAIIDDSLFHIDYARSVLYFDNKRNYDNITISYRVFPIDFTQKHFHKDYTKLVDTINSPDNIYIYNFKPETGNDIFGNKELNKRGSISRGISFGNNQDVIVNSGLNLQLSGKVSENLNILAAITDNNIPIQPDGNTQQIQEFDKVFISLFNDNINLTVGDFELKKPTGYFMRMFKKVQGANISIKTKKKRFEIINTISGAISKGKYNRQAITGIEGNQGPYKLSGAENESFIIILAGSEKVYIDGQLMMRGQDQDYIIDYNTAELTFTPRQPITKDKRIIVEFEYSDKNYARFLIANNNEFISEKGKLWINIYSEQDSKNQSIHQDLSDDDKNLLSLIGDSIHQAYVYNIDSVEFSNDYVLYKMIDTTIASVTYDSIFVYSTNPDSAFFRLGFTNVGANNGNYIQLQSSANGRVYKWVQPLNGIPQGDYEPIILLVTPKKKQMMSVGGIYKLSNTLSTNFEFSATNNDINTFSKLHNNDNAGYAIKTGLVHQTKFKDSTINIITSVDYQLTDKNFIPIERYRSTEFERNWNLSDNTLEGNEHFVTSGLILNYKQYGFAKYDFQYMNRNKNLNAYKNNFGTNINIMGFTVDFDGSLLSTKDNLNSSGFLRYKTSISKSVAFIRIGLTSEQETNKWTKNNNDSLLGNSFSYNQTGIFVQNMDSAKNRIFASYHQRQDYLPYNGELQYSSLAEEYNAGIHFKKNTNNILKLTCNYRKLGIIDTLVSTNEPENTITGRIEYNLRLLKNTISSNTFYEIGSGMEVKKEFTYLEVATGQGVYTWTDYNNNGVKELDEFETANFIDQANYIRIYTPTNDYIKTYNNQFSQMFFIRPEMIWRKEKGIKKLVSKLSDQMAFRLNKKNLQDDFITNANPFTSSVKDSVLISMNSSLRNTLYFNRTNAKFSLSYIFQNNNSKTLLVNGIDTRTSLSNGLQTRWNITRIITVIDNCSLGNKTFDSEFFDSKNYNIEFIQNQASIQFQPLISIRISLLHKYFEKKNISGQEQATGNDIGTELRYNVLKKGNLSIKINYINIRFNSDTNSPVAYEMLEGFNPGNNATWALIYQRNISKSLQMNINYNGRVSEGSKVIHIAGMQLRAYF